MEQPKGRDARLDFMAAVAPTQVQNELPQPNTEITFTWFHYVV